MLPIGEEIVSGHAVPDRKYRRKEAAQFLRDECNVPVTEQRLARAAVYGDGPEYHLFGRTPLYSERALREWAASRLSAPRRSSSAHQAMTTKGAR